MAAAAVCEQRASLLIIITRRINSGRLPAPQKSTFPRRQVRALLNLNAAERKIGPPASDHFLPLVFIIRLCLREGAALSKRRPFHLNN